MTQHDRNEFYFLRNKGLLSFNDAYLESKFNLRVEY